MAHSNDNESENDMTNPGADLFGNAGSGGSYPKLESLEGQLILIKPEKIEVVPKPKEFGGKPGDTQDRLTADVVVFADDGTWETYDEMYLSQKVLVNAGRKALKPGAQPYVLGRVGKVPSSIGKEQGFDTTEKINAGLAEHFRSGGKKPKPNFAWGLEDHTPEEVAVALKYLASSGPMANASAE